MFLLTAMFLLQAGFGINECSSLLIFHISVP